ncbi:MAG: hypothetical protein OHK0047_02270 [Leptolyngbyaceae cyanobacterium]
MIKRPQNAAAASGFDPWKMPPEPQAMGSKPVIERIAVPKKWAKSLEQYSGFWNK